MATCGTCGTAHQPDGARFCFSCGGSLAAPGCTACGADLIPGARFCSSCGALQESADQEPVGHAVSARRVASVLFGDLVGFTTLSESRDAEEVRELLSRYFEEARQIVLRYGGTVEKFIGDAVMAVWGVPSAHEDDAERAVRAGLELVTRITAMGADLGVPDLAMRVGVVTGEVAVTVGATQQGMVAGDAVNTASRIQSAAAPGQVWVDETTRLLTSGAVSYVDVGSHRLKGKVDPVPLWSARAIVAAVGGSQRADGLEAPLVGRERELRLVKEVFHGVEETGRPALLVVGGEAGVGKSRLGWELFKYVDGLSRPVRWHSGRCLGYGEGVAFFALADAIRARLQLSRDDEDADAASLLATGLERYVADPEERTWLEPRLGALLGIGSPGAFPREDLFTAWSTFLRRVAEDEHPLVLLIDDAHHADDGLVDFIEHLLAVAGFGCLIVLLTRPGLLEAHPTLASNRRSTVLHLEPLPGPEMAGLVDGLVAGLPAVVRSALVDRAEGIPLYAVETVRALVDRDLVVPRGGQYVLADPDSFDLDTIGAPASLQTLIAARLDTLTPAQRRVVDVGSVLGNSFTRESIERLCPDVPAAEEVLAALVRLQVLQQEGSRFSAERGQYQFVQSAVRQVAYLSLTRRDRKTAHLAVVADLLGHEGNATELAALIAQHYLEAIDVLPDADDVPELTALAVESLRTAADRAAALGSPSEAVGHLAEALDRCPDDHEHAELALALAVQLEHAGRYSEALALAEQTGADFRELGADLPAAAATAVQGASLLGLHEHRRAKDVVRPVYDHLRGNPEASGILLKLGRVLAAASIGLGVSSRELLDELIPLAEQIGDRTATADFYVTLGVHFQTIGANKIGVVLNEAAADLARRDHDPVLLARALINLSAGTNQDDASAGGDYAREALATARSTGRSNYVSTAAVNFAVAQWITGAWDDLPSLQDEALLEPADALVIDLLVGATRVERGEPVARFGQTASDQAASDGGDLVIDAWQALERAWRGHHLDRDPRASVEAVKAVRALHEGAGLYDDFALLWGLAAQISFEAGQREDLDAICAIVDDVPETALVNGLRGHRSYIAALLAERDAPEAAADHFRDAITHYAAWHAPFLTARARVGLARSLRARGEHAEASCEEDAARETFVSLRATGWLEQLDQLEEGARADAALPSRGTPS